MKAEERKRLETNALAARLTRFWEGLKGRSGYLIVGTVVLIAAILFGYYYISGMYHAANVVRWSNLQTADTKPQLEDLARENRGKLVGQVATIDLARLGLGPEGEDQAATLDPDQRKSALASIEAARQNYLSAAAELKDQPALQQEAYVGAAKAEETLIGVPKADNPSEMRGNIDKAIEYYAKAASIWPDSEPSKVPAARAEYLRNNRDAVVKFYTDLNSQLYLAPPPAPK